MTALKFNVSNDTDTWIYVDNGESFAGNINADDIVNISFAHSVVARFIRFIPISFYSWPSMSVGLELCIPFQTWQQNTCTNKIYNPTTTYKTTNGNFANCTQSASLGDTGGWCLRGSPLYMDVDMTHIARVNGAAIEGKSEERYYNMLKK